ncbi:putative non-specific serine/threonine protein kinase [Helianthus annuus]|uniref:Non-specific serine/threonine protein kinase n=1 Tax=Helianthus annuus TaxID=4232 RepID=A0A9K3JCJ2_HELAN|nr:putative non-specific serine/threonine protein kinase [Helianthus annuus]
MKILHFYPFLFLFMLFICSSAADPFTEALISLKSELIDPSNALNNWVLPKDQNPSQKIQSCSWVGVKCNQNSTKITSLDLSLKNLGGFLSGSQLYQFVDLIVLNISHNSFSGSLPVGIFNLTNLNTLDISRNNFSGVFPYGISKLQKLIVLDAFSNSFSGSLPPDVCEIASVKVVNFAGSYFSGPIPNSYGLCKNLDFIHLAGTIPWQFGNMSELRYLDIAGANLSGTIPKELGIAKLPNLESLLIWDNFFSGTLPQELGMHSKLKWVDVSTNDFVGVIPPGICSGGELSRLMLFSNWFSGGLSSISNCSSLVRIRLEDNLFSGDIDLDFRILSDVSYVDLSGNRFTGGIPYDIFHALSLEHFSVSNNTNLGGILPEKAWSLPVLRNFSASSCNISGNFPEFPFCKSLSFIDLNRNHLSGGIPESISVCENLETLNFAENNLSGEIPVKLGSLMKLKFLNLSYNDLSGSIPNGNTFKTMDSTIPHGDLKASNIVFDENMEPCLAEFGFKTISAMETGEYKGLMDHDLKDDVFGFGEVVLEILTNGRRKNGGISIHKTPKDVLLKEIYNDNEVSASCSSSSSSKSIQEEIKLVVEVVLACTTSKQSDRPSMEDVLKILSGLKPLKK